MGRASPLSATADRLFVWLRTKPVLLRLTWLTRILLAAAFIPTGAVKLLGQRFTVMSVETPIGAFFEAMYQTGLFWSFIGAVQIAAGILLLLPRWAHLGAALFLPVAVNIFVITLSMDFRGTPFVTGLMVLATLYLAAWDYDRFRAMLTRAPLAAEHRAPPLELDALERLGFAALAAALLTFFAITRGFAPKALIVPSIAVGLTAGVFVLFRVVLVRRR